MPGPLKPVVFFHDIGDHDRALVGGKGLQLGRLTRAGFPVPPGFVVTTDALSRRDDEAGVLDAVRDAYRTLGCGPVAVRSSATSEDGTDASFAGQQETFLNVEGEEDVVDAVRRCRDSLATERATAYRLAMGVDDRAAAMAVVVQRMARADAAGVLFTRDPTASDADDRMLVEAVRGLGEALVSGRATPDRWTLRRDDGGAVLSSEGTTGSTPILGDERLRELAALARRVEAVYDGEAQDIEWAWSERDGFALLQSRPVTAGANERERVRREEIAFLRARAEPEGTVWARYSLAEVLPEPLPMTWALWKQFLSGRGGYGRMYRALGYDPAPSLDDDGVVDLITGRPYFNLSREARLYFKDFPQSYPFAALKADPSLAIYPKLRADLSRAPKGFLWKLPNVAARMMTAEKTLERAAETVPSRLEDEVFPAAARFAAEWMTTDLSRLSDAELAEAFAACRADVFDRFAPDTLAPSVLAGLAVEKLRAAVANDAGRLDTLLAGGTAGRPEWDLARGLRALAAGELGRDAFLEHFGHRGPGEMELANPRWRETPGVLTTPPVAAEPPDAPAPASPMKAEAKFAARARRLLGLREAGKHHLMRAYEPLRRILLEVERRARFGASDGVFYLEPHEIGDALADPARFRPTVAARRRRRALALGLEAPRVVFSDDVEALGRTAPSLGKGGDVLRGVGVAPGVAEGVALVLRRPEDAPADARGFVLVCPSTDPGWVPLFLRARGLVLETGGVLSHGAIVAREFGLPAVANVPDACRRLSDGQRLRVDGGTGTVTFL